jgi:16S rRNA (adenine1518-N6/adenine1519-N6)-dimethyltransferase
VTLTRKEVLGLLEQHDLRPSRALGQNFVVDPNTVRRIARLSGVGPGDRVLEIGAGLGSLTVALAETGAEVVAVERDRRLLPALLPLVEPLGVRVVQGDALSLDWQALLGTGDGWVMVANLPYNVAVPLVMDLLQKVEGISRMLVMVQREVAARLAARAGEEAYGAVSVKLAYRARASVVGRVPSTVFVPKPRVESALVAIERLDEPAVSADEELLFTLVKAGFAHRRKMLRRALAGLASEEVLVAAGVNPEARAEELDIEAWGRLALCATHSERSPS